MTVFATRLSPLNGLDPALDALRIEASASGFLFLDRLVADWKSGANRFEGQGEILLGAYVGNTLAGTAGLNHDPYDPEDAIGRLRHLYVAEAYRRRGIGSCLVDAIFDRARSFYRVVRLRTNTRSAGDFYLRHGFVGVDHIWATHIKALETGHHCR